METSGVTNGDSDSSELLLSPNSLLVAVAGGVTTLTDFLGDGVTDALKIVAAGGLFFSTCTPWGRRGRIRPQHPLACRKRRLNGAACLPWTATRVA